MAVYRYIKVRRQFEGIHKYADAPDEVAFLRNNHRHIFKVEAKVEVHHDDRELEFFLVHQTMDREILPFIQLVDDLGSCEMMAERILEGLKATYGNERFYEVSVSEDGENDGIVVYEPDSD